MISLTGESRQAGWFWARRWSSADPWSRGSPSLASLGTAGGTRNAAFAQPPGRRSLWGAPLGRTRLLSRWMRPNSRSSIEGDAFQCASLPNWLPAPGAERQAHFRGRPQSPPPSFGAPGGRVWQKAGSAALDSSGSPANRERTAESQGRLCHWGALLEPCCLSLATG